MTLLERDALWAQLQDHCSRASAGPGRLVFVEGEAGIGKTALLRSFALAQKDRLPVLWGACDALQTPRPLGALDDIAMQSDGELRTLLAAGAERHRIFVAFVDLLAAQPALVVIEDLHWADEATLDLLRYAGRRIARTRSLLLASFRSDELVPAHPLRGLLGDLATTGAPRLAPAPLSIDAVRALVGETGLNAVELHRRTGGNPFFVTEVLATPESTLPATVRDAVLARAARLGPSARAVLDAAAVAGPRVEPWLLQALTAAESGAIDECLATGVLRADAGLFVFRHELAREAVLHALTPTRAMSLHRLVLQALESRGVSNIDAARLAHHADAADDAQAVLCHAPAAARDAAARGAHRQAAAHYARALKHAASSAAERAALLDGYAGECQPCGLLDEAIDARREAAQRWSEAGDDAGAAVSSARLAMLLVQGGHNAQAEASMRVATALIGPGEETAQALAVRSWSASLRMLDRDADEAIEQARGALALAERLADRASIVQCLNTIGSAMLCAGRIDEGRGYLEQGLALGERWCNDRWIAGALTNLGSGCGEIHRLDLAEGYLLRGIHFCGERDLDAARLYQLSWLALVRLHQGRWDEACDAAHGVLAEPRGAGIARIMALIALGRVRARRGDPAVWQALDEACALAGGTATLQRVAPMCAARAEAAWLEGRNDLAAREAGAGIELALRKRHAGFVAELVLWCRRGGASTALPSFCAQHPFALEAAGLWQEAAAAWRALACPYEAACALAEGDETAQREALATFESLGARPMVERVRHRLRAAGVRGLPRGPRESTKQHPAGLTGKETAVLVLVVAGLRNKEIAQRLNRSPRTIDHHVEAIFAKLGVATRAEAVSAAHRIGVVSATVTDPRTA